MNYDKIGILMQGPISAWTIEIVKEYKKHFPESEILLSTWNSEKVEGITCEVIVSDEPKSTSPYQSNTNHQKIGVLNGLKKFSSEIVMKCRTDQFIHNKNIFKIFENYCPKHKMMIPNYCTIESIPYFASDFCQIAAKEILLDYWNSIPYYDGSFMIYHPEIYLTQNYVLLNKKDMRSWSICLKEYYYVKGYLEDFQIEWEKMAKNELYRKIFNDWYPKCVKPDM
jgi:hypothetical protein